MPRHIIIYSTGLLVGLLCVFILNKAGINEQAVRESIRLTAATTYILLLCAFCARPLIQTTRSPLARSLLRARRQIGISVAISHSYHLLMILLLIPVVFDGDPAGLGSLADLAPGIAVYAILYAMALTSNNYSQRLLGKNWKRLHTLGIYTLMIAFTAAYGGNAIESGGLYWPLFGTALAAFLLRSMAWQRRRATTTQPG